MTVLVENFLKKYYVATNISGFMDNESGLG